MIHATRESVAYDYARFDRRRTVREAVRNEAPVRRDSARAKKEAGSLLPGALAFIMVVTVSIVILFNYMTVTELVDKEAELKVEYEQLKSEENYLVAQQKKLQNLNYIEEYAQKKLNMVKLDKDQIEYIDIKNPDRVRL